MRSHRGSLFAAVLHSPHISLRPGPHSTVPGPGERLDDQRLYGYDGGAAASHARSEGQGPEKGQFSDSPKFGPSQALF